MGFINLASWMHSPPKYSMRVLTGGGVIHEVKILLYITRKKCCHIGTMAIKMKFRTIMKKTSPISCFDSKMAFRVTTTTHFQIICLFSIIKHKCECTWFGCYSLSSVCIGYTHIIHILVCKQSLHATDVREIQYNRETLMSLLYSSCIYLA